MRGVLRVGIVLVMVLVMVLVGLVAGTCARWWVATSLRIDARGRRGMGMAIDGLDGVLVLVVGIGKGWWLWVEGRGVRGL